MLRPKLNWWIIKRRKVTFFFDYQHISGCKNLFPAGNYMFKVNNRNTRTRCEICSKLTIKDQDNARHRSGVLIVKFELENAGWVYWFWLIIRLIRKATSPGNKAQSQYNLSVLKLPLNLISLEKQFNFITWINKVWSRKCN